MTNFGDSPIGFLLPWRNLDLARAKLAEGMDPTAGYSPPLHEAAQLGSPEVLAEFARQVDDVDMLCEGRTALWRAVAANRPDNAAVLVAAGADPWRDMMAGWSPGRLSLVTPAPERFAEVVGQGDVSLTPEETAAVAERDRLLAVVGDRYVDGLGIACVAGIDVAEAVRRLDATTGPVDLEQVRDWWDNMPDGDTTLTMWATDVPGGCVLTQPWGYGPQMPKVSKALSVGTTCYGMYANPKSGNQGSIARDGQLVGWDLHPGGDPDEVGDVLLTYLYQHHALAYCFAYPGCARPTPVRSPVRRTPWSAFPNAITGAEPPLALNDEMHSSDWTV
ncbi:hypothetical protein GCM10029964_058790 [Kibdelosporangium lantanae]